MALNLNHFTVQGTVIAVTENEYNTRVVLKLRDDYVYDNEVTKREYILPVRFTGRDKENAAKLIEKDMYITVEGKITSYKPKDAKYDTLALDGYRFHLLPKYLVDDDDGSQTRTTRSNSFDDNPFEDEDDVPEVNW